MIEIKKILFADKENMKKCFSIRKEVFIEEQRCDPKDEYENEEESIHFLLIHNNIECATARYRETNKGIKMERFAVLKAQRGKGYGLLILKAINLIKNKIPLKLLIAGSGKNFIKLKRSSKFVFPQNENICFLFFDCRKIDDL